MIRRTKPRKALRESPTTRSSAAAERTSDITSHLGDSKATKINLMGLTTPFENQIRLDREIGLLLRTFVKKFRSLDAQANSSFQALMVQVVALGTCALGGPLVFRALVDMSNYLITKQPHVEAARRWAVPRHEVCTGMVSRALIIVGKQLIAVCKPREAYACLHAASITIHPNLPGTHGIYNERVVQFRDAALGYCKEVTAAWPILDLRLPLELAWMIREDLQGELSNRVSLAPMYAVLK